MRVASPIRSARRTSYAGGYATSKWAGEVLLREAHDLCGLPVTVFRSDMILAHSRYCRQLNVPDMFTRLMLSLVATGIAPARSIELDAAVKPAAGPLRRAASRFHRRSDHQAWVGRAHRRFRTYNVLNTHDDGISLDTFVDWLIAAGITIERIDDYGMAHQV